MASHGKKSWVASSLRRSARGARAEGLIAVAAAGVIAGIWSGGSPRASADVWQPLSGTATGTWDVNTTANWDVGGFQNGDNATFNDIAGQNSGTVTIDSGGVSPNSVHVNNANTAYTLTGGSISSPNGLEKEGTGSLVISNTSLSFAAGWLVVGAGQPGGTLEIGSGSSMTTTGRMDLATTGSGSGIINIDAGAGTFTLGGDGGGTSNFIGVDGGNGTMNVAGGTVNFGAYASSGSIGYLRIASNAGSTGLLNVTGGTVNVGTSASLNGFYDNSANATSSNGTLIISGSGVVNIGTSTATATNGTIGALYLSNSSGGSGSATVNLNGGTLSLAQIIAGTSGTNTINFNGGILQANSSAQGANFLNASSALSVNVQAGGATIDPQANNVTITAPLVHSGGGTDGGLTKIGSGILILAAGNTFNGGTTVSAGTLALDYNPGDTPTGSLAGGAPITVGASGTLRFDLEDALGYGSGLASQINILGGNVTTNTGSNFRVTLPTLNFTGGTLGSGAGNTGDGAGEYLFAGNVNTNAASTTAVINAGTISGWGYFNVASGTTPSGVDLSVSSNLEGFFGGYAQIEKEGPGRMLYTGTMSNLAGGSVYIGQFQNGGTLEFGAGANVNTTGRFNVGGGNGAAYGVVDVDAGAGTLTFGGDGGGNSNFIGVDSGNGTMNVAGGTVNFGPYASSSSTGYLRIGSNTNATGLLNVTGGTVNVGTSASLNGFYDNSANATSSNGTLGISGSGVVNIGTSTATATNGTIGALYLSNSSGGSGSATVNLNGGTLSLAQIIAGTSGTNVVNLNGGTLQANSNAQAADFLDPSSALNVYVGANTSTIDTQANNITIAAPLLTSGGTDGGLIKIGSGNLTLSNLTSSFTGNVVVSAGTLIAATGGNDLNRVTSVLGNPQIFGRQISVSSGAELEFTNSDVLGNAGSTPQSAIVVNGGTLLSTGGGFVTLGPVTLNGGTMTDDGGASFSGGANFLTGGISLNGNVTVIGSTPSYITGTAAQYTRFVINNVTNSTTFNVANVTGGGADLTVSAVIGDTWSNGAGALVKTGNGEMVLDAPNIYTGGTTVSAGTLVLAYNLNDQPTGTLAGGSTITVGSSGTLRFDIEDALGYGAGIPAQLNINGGTVTTANVASSVPVNGGFNGTAFRVTLPPLNFTGGTLSSGTNNNGDAYGGSYLLTSINTNAASTTAVINANSLSIIGSPTWTVASGNTTSGIDLNVSSVIEDWGGANVLTKAGAGVLALSGASVYSGGTTVSAGTLLANSSDTTNGSTGPGLVTVGTGATLGGTGVIKGGLTVTGGGILTAGGDASHGAVATSGAPGQLNANFGTATFASGSNLNIKVDNVTGAAGTGYDQVLMDGLSIGGAVDVNLYGLTAGNVAGATPGFNATTSFTLAEVADFSGVTPSALASDISPSGFVLNTANFTNNNAISPGSVFGLVAVSDGNGGAALDVVYVASPEPGTAMLGLGAIAPILLARRRRSRRISRLSQIC